MTTFVRSLLLSLWVAAPGLSAPSADEILARADEIRMPSGDFSLDVEVVFSRPGRAAHSAQYEVLFKGQDRTLIKTMAPANDRGTSILMVDRDMWVFLPSVSKPVRVALQQRLVGDVAYGDLARANFRGDYEPRLVETKATSYKLKLKAKNESVTYGSVDLWVDRATFRPVRAAFYAASGRLLKVGSYEDYAPLAGAQRPTRLVIHDAVVKGQQSTIHYRRMASEAVPEKYFTKDYLKKLKY
jgi:outer membrane lipoprotein-sorting protein